MFLKNNLVYWIVVVVGDESEPARLVRLLVAHHQALGDVSIVGKVRL